MEKIDTESYTEVRLTNEEATDICRLEQKENRCAFLTFDEKGFACIRDSDLKDVILDKIKDGTMSAKGEGGWEGCAWNNQEENP